MEFSQIFNFVEIGGNNYMLEIDQETTRAAFGKTVLMLARKNDKIFAISNDALPNMGLGPMLKEFPNRTLNLGIAEQNTMGVAAGLAATGMTVVVGEYAVFSTMRSVEQFRTFIAYPNLNVKVSGGMGGLSAAGEGVTHMGLEDVGIMRLFPNTIVTVPADAVSTRLITEAILKVYGPAYIRLGKGLYYKVFDESYRFVIGKANLLVEGYDATIITNGPMVYRSLEAYRKLKNEGIQVRVLEMPCVKPIDEEAILSAAQETGAIITAEDHTIIGGLGGAVAEILSEQCPTIMKRLGIRDVFPESGDHDDLMDKYGLAISDVVTAVKEVIAKKSK